ncbi:hypothetical protein K2P56_00445 [Patescibacteria group bacterium]|nr:hypothetical protein [Patescibacteria group bacterium]
MRNGEKVQLPSDERSSRRRFGLVMSFVVGAGVAVGVPVWKEMNRQINARIEMEVATRLYQATKEERRAGFVDGICASRDIGVLDLGTRQGTNVEATGSYSTDAENAGHEIAMALGECGRIAE